MRGLGQGQVKPLGQEQEHVQEPRRQQDVVVHHQQPIMTGGGVALQQLVEVLELAPVAGDRCGEPHVVAGLQQPRARPVQHVGHVGPLHAQRQHASPRPRPRRPAQPPRLQPEQRRAVADGVAQQCPGGGPDAPHLPAGA
jgi:hypothetical protein